MSRYDGIETAVFEPIPAGTPVPRIRRIEQRDRFTTAAASLQTLPSGTHLEVENTSIRQSNFDADYLIPLAIAATAGGVIWIAGLSLARTLHEANIATAVAAILFVALFLLLIWRIDHVSSVERILGERESETPSPPETVINQPVAEPQLIKVETPHADGRGKSVNHLELPPAIAAKLPTIARAIIVDGVALSRRGLSGVVTEKEYAALLAALKKGKFVHVEKGKPVELKSVGRAMLRHYLPQS